MSECRLSAPQRGLILKMAQEKVAPVAAGDAGRSVRSLIARGLAIPCTRGGSPPHSFRPQFARLTGKGRMVAYGLMRAEGLPLVAL